MTAERYSLPTLAPFGIIRRTHGHMGAFVITLHSDALLDTDTDYLFVDMDGIPVPYELVSLRGSADRLIVEVVGIGSAEAADQLRGHQVWIDQSHYPHTDLSESDGYQMLRDYQVMHPTMGRIGQIAGIDDTTSNVLLIIRPHDDPEQELLIPLVDGWITEHDPKHRTITLDCPPELFEL